MPRRRMSSGTVRYRTATRWCLCALLLFTAAAGCRALSPESKLSPRLSGVGGAARAPPQSSSADGVPAATDAMPPPQAQRLAPAPSCDEVFVVSAPPACASAGGRPGAHAALTPEARPEQGGLDYRLTTADVRCAFSQFGSVLEVQAPISPCALGATVPGAWWLSIATLRQVKLPSGETEGHANKGYSFVRYKDPRSCILAVENMDGYLPCPSPAHTGTCVLTPDPSDGAQAVCINAAPLLARASTPADHGPRVIADG